MKSYVKLTINIDQTNPLQNLFLKIKQDKDFSLMYDRLKVFHVKYY
jgi:hypothetical protein